MGATQIVANREQWLTDALELLRPEFLAHGYYMPKRLAVSCSYSVNGAGNTIGQCVQPIYSERGYIELLISPQLAAEADAQGPLATLVHETCHAILLDQGVYDRGAEAHGSEFKSIARAVGLEGPLTATSAGDDLCEFIRWSVIPRLGRYPHGAVRWQNGRSRSLPPAIPPGIPLPRPFDAPRKQSTYMLKASCECGYTIRLTAKWAAVGVPDCPVCHTPLLLEKSLREAA